MKNYKIILAISALILAISCETSYRMITVLDKNGQTHREIYAHGNKAFMQGDASENPFLFALDSTWRIERFDRDTPIDETLAAKSAFGSEEKMNVKISKITASIDNFTKDITYDKDKRSLAAPEEILLKKKRWFYTIYSFKAAYHKFQYEVPVSINDYLSKEEQLLWTQGGMCDYKIMNGTEMKDYLNDIEGNFLRWYECNFFEICFEGIQKLNTRYDLKVDKEKLYKQTTDFVNDDPTKINSELVCNVLDSYYQTDYFSKLYHANAEVLDRDFENAIAICQLVPYVISYELVVPGDILQSNAPIIENNTLIWKVDGTRLLFDDFILTAEYRVINRWAFWITGLLLLVAVGSSVVLLTKKIRS